MTHLDEEALAAKAWADLEFAASATGALEVANITLPIEKVRALVSERSALPSSPVSELVGRLEKLAKWADESQHEKWCGRKDVPVHGFSGEGILIREAASTLTTLSTRNDELEREVKRLREVQQWQPIETAPKDGLVDIWIDHGDGTGVRRCDCYYDRICDEWRTSRPSGRLLTIKARHVTHWMSPPALSTSPQGGEHE